MKNNLPESIEAKLKEKKKLWKTPKHVFEFFREDDVREILQEALEEQEEEIKENLISKLRKRKQLAKVNTKNEISRIFDDGWSQAFVAAEFEILGMLNKGYEALKESTGEEQWDQEIFKELDNERTGLKDSSDTNKVRYRIVGIVARALEDQESRHRKEKERLLLPNHKKQRFEALREFSENLFLSSFWKDINASYPATAKNLRCYIEFLVKAQRD